MRRGFMKKSTKTFKYANFEEVMAGEKKPHYVRLTKTLQAQSDINYSVAEEIYDYYIKNTGYVGKNTKKTTSQAILKLLKNNTAETLKTCVDNYVKEGVQGKYAYAPHNFFSRFDNDCAYYRNYMPQEQVDEIVKKTEKIPTFNEVKLDDDLHEMPH